MKKSISFAANENKVNNLLLNGLKAYKHLTRYLRSDKCKLENDCYFQTKYLQKVTSCIEPLDLARGYISECISENSKCSQSSAKYEVLNTLAGECFYEWVYDYKHVSSSVGFDLSNDDKG